MGNSNPTGVFHRRHARRSVWLFKERCSPREQKSGSGVQDRASQIITWHGFPHPAGVLALPEGAAFAHAASVRARTSRVHHPAALPKGMISRKAVTRLSAIMSRRDRSGAAALPDTRCAPGSRESDAGIMGEVSKVWIKSEKKSEAPLDPPRIDWDGPPGDGSVTSLSVGRGVASQESNLLIVG
jgi:hypothetical protein